MYDNEKILQIMPAPEGLRYSYDEGKPQNRCPSWPWWSCRAGYGRSMLTGAENCEFFTDLTENGATLVDTSSC